MAGGWGGAGRGRAGQGWRDSWPNKSKQGERRPLPVLPDDPKRNQIGIHTVYLGEASRGMEGRRRLLPVPSPGFFFHLHPFFLTSGNAGSFIVPAW